MCSVISSGSSNRDSRTDWQSVCQTPMRNRKNSLLLDRKTSDVFPRCCDQHFHSRWTDANPSCDKCLR